MADEETTSPRRKRPTRKDSDAPVDQIGHQTVDVAAAVSNATPSDNETNDLLRQLLEARQQDRAELAALRQEFAQSRTVAPVPVRTAAMSEEELVAERLREIEEHAFYCPGCGALYKRERDCNGRGEAPHPAIEVVSTDELKSGDPSRHTEAPGVRP